MKEGRTRVGARSLLWLVALVVAGMPAMGEGERPAVRAHGLRVQKIEVLEEALKLTMELYRAGQAGIAEVMAVRKDLLATRLGQMQGPASRVEILKKEVPHAKEFEKIVEAQFKNGTVNRAALLQAKAYRLDVEIQAADAEAAASRRTVRPRVQRLEKPEQ